MTTIKIMTGKEDRGKNRECVVRDRMQGGGTKREIRVGHVKTTRGENEGKCERKG